MYKFLRGPIFSFLLGIYLGMFISWLSGDSLTFAGAARLIIQASSVYIPTGSIQRFFLCIITNIFFFLLTFLVGITWVSCNYDLYFLIFSCAYLQRNVCSDVLPIFKKLKYNCFTMLCICYIELFVYY